jgi:CHAT domain-containing protein/tetratricopeptide (TPR) repeat protein
MKFSRFRRPFFFSAVFLFFVTIVTLPPSYFLGRANHQFTRAHHEQAAVLNKKALTTAGDGPTADAAAQTFAEAEKLRSEQREESSRKAVQKYLDAANLWKTTKDPKQAIDALRKAGEILQLLGETASALERYNEALTIARDLEMRLEEGRLLNDLAYTYFITGNSSEAQKRGLAALKIGRELHDQQVEAEALSNLGETFFIFGDLAKAQDNQQHSLKLWRQLGIVRGQAVSLIALSYYKANLGDPTGAIDCYNEGLSLARTSNDLVAQTLALIAIGNIKRKFGEPQQALHSYSEAKALAERTGDRTSQAIVSGGMASLYFQMGDKRRAVQLMETATNLFAANGQNWGAAEGKLDLGRIRQSLGDHERALAYLNEAHELFNSLRMQRLQSQTLRAMGSSYYSLGDTTRSLRSYQQALDLMRSGQDQRQDAYTLNYMGNVYERLKRPDLALSYYRRALPLSRISADPIGEALALYNLAHVEKTTGNIVEAGHDIEKAIGIVESLRTKVFNQDLRTSYFATVRDMYELYADVLMLLNKQKPNSGFDARAFAISERSRARSFLELLVEARANVREGIDQNLLKRENELSEALNIKAQRQTQLLPSRNEREIDAINKEIETLSSDLAQVRDQIRSKSPRYAALTSPQPLNLSEVQSQVIKDESVLLEYSLGDDRSYVWLVTRNSMTAYDLPPRAEVGDVARRLYQLLTAFQQVYGESIGQTAERRRQAAAAMPAEIARLSKMVLGPLAGQLQTKRLVIIPDGALQYIPFQMLLDPDSSKSLLVDHEIIYEPSASTLGLLLSESGSRKLKDNSVAVLADPVFEADDPRVKRSENAAAQTVDTTELKQALRDIGLSPDGVEIPRLLASRMEADSIIDAVPWGTGLKAVGFSATRDRVLQPDLGDYRVVHFATHGVINNDHPDLSGIVLSLFDEQGRPQDGFLRLHDIYNLNLPADLVVLSACSTGLGNDVKGEGLVGLTRGFMYAGASSVIASLWKVDDEATAELMKQFYAEIFKNGLTPAAALRQAQLAMSKHERWNAPYYWAGFVIQGRYDQQVAVSGSKAFIPVLITAVLVVFAGLITTTILIIRRRRA